MNAPSDVTFVLHHEKQNVFIHVQIVEYQVRCYLCLKYDEHFFNTVTETKIDVK